MISNSSPSRWGRRLALVTATMAGIFAAAASPAYAVLVEDDNTKIYQAPDFSSPAIATLDRGDDFDPICDAGGMTWGRHDPDGAGPRPAIEGFVHGGRLDFTPDEEC